MHVFSLFLVECISVYESTQSVDSRWRCNTGGCQVTFLGIFVNINDKRKPKTPSQLLGPVPKRGVKRPNYDDNYMAATRSSI